MAEAPEKLYDWSGSRILRLTGINGKRWVIGHEDVPIPTDLREWITPSDRQEIRDVLSVLGLPSEKTRGAFDKRARLVWKYVVEHVEYHHDSDSHLKSDFWQFPAETLVLKKGDCEDCAFLLASLLLATGISSFCVRVVLGRLTQRSGSRGWHAWPIYKDENGVWRVLEATLDKVPGRWPSADHLADPDSLPLYDPDICLNQHHVWAVGPRRIPDVRAYVRSRRRPLKDEKR